MWIKAGALVWVGIFCWTTLSVFGQAIPEPPQLPAGPMKGRTMAACTGCHDTHIIVQQRLSKVAWTKEVDKMTKWGAMVDPKDRDALIDYLSSHFGVDENPYQPQRSAGSKWRK